MSADDAGWRQLRPPTRRTLGGVVVVVGVFIGVTAIAQWYTADIDGMAHSLAVDAAPSIERLSIGRGDLRRMTFEARDSLRALDTGLAVDDSRLIEAHKSLDAMLAAYVEEPPYPGEADLRRAAILGVELYMRALDELLDQMRHHELAAAHRTMATTFMPASDRADRAFERLERFDADYAIRTAAKITHARRRATHLSYALATLAAFAAILVMGVSARATQSFAATATALARIEEERKDLAERRAVELELFAARVAHDLRNPLGAIGMRASVAGAHCDDPTAVRDDLTRIGHGVDRATDIIEALLKFARSGGASDPGAHTDVAAGISAAVEDIADDAAAAGIKLVVPSPPALEIACSTGALLSVLENLLRNAVKHMGDTPAGERLICVHVIDEQATVRVEVEDTGPGVPPQNASQIFEPFVRASRANAPGLGLGLATVKRMIEAHGGRVGIRPGQSRGSCFWFELAKLPHKEDSKSC